jgi:hypothetical protein
MRSLRGQVGKISTLAPDDPITQLILGVFSRDMLENKAREALETLRGLVVDYNELRVMSPREMAENLREHPDAWHKCEDVSRALNKIFAKQHTVGLDHLKGRSRKDAQEYLDKVEGLDPYTRARIRLLGLQQHAIPLDEAMWALAKREEIVDPNCPLDEAQAFLERQVPESEALDFVSRLKKHAWSEMGAAVKGGQVDKISSRPPSRVGRNMLQPISRTLPESITGETEDDGQPAPATAAAKSAPARKSSPRKAPVRSRKTVPKPAARPKPRAARPKATAKKRAARTRKAPRPGRTTSGKRDRQR